MRDAALSPTTAGVSTQRRLREPRGRINYRPPLSGDVRPTAEREFARLVGARSEGAAGQRMLRARAEYALAIQACRTVGAPAREQWLRQPERDIDATTPTPEYTPDLIADAATVDGEENGPLAILAAHPEDAQAARNALRAIRREAAAKAAVARAIEAHFGMAVL